MATAASSSSLIFFPSSLNLSTPTLSPKTLALSPAPSPLLSLAASSSKSSALKVFALLGGRPRGLRSSFALNVAVSSDLEVDQGSYEDEPSSDNEANFSPDLKLFVGNLPFNVDSAELAGLFERAGNVEMVEVIYDKLTGRSRGFGFVTMSSMEEVQAAAQQFNGYELDGRPLRVNSGPPPPRGEGQMRAPRVGGGGGGGGGAGSGNRVYVGNLSWGVDDLALENLFSEHGKVLEAKVVYDRDSGRSRGFGFVTYSSSEEVNGAISSLNGVDLDGRSIRVSVAEARPPRRMY